MRQAGGIDLQGMCHAWWCAGPPCTPNGPTPCNPSKSTGLRSLVHCKPADRKSHVCILHYESSVVSPARRIHIIVASHNGFATPNFDDPRLRRLASVTVHVYDDMRAPEALRVNSPVPRSASARVSVRNTGIGFCTAEAVPYLQGIMDLVRGGAVASGAVDSSGSSGSSVGTRIMALSTDDLVVFSHDHERGWHQTEPLREALIRRYARTNPLPLPSSSSQTSLCAWLSINAAWRDACMLQAVS